MRLPTLVATITALLAATPLVQASEITETGSIAPRLTNFTDTSSLSFAQFDPSLGTLNWVSISITGTVLGTARAESMDSAPTMLSLDLSAIETLTTPLTSILASVAPDAHLSFAATAYDGTLDFGGTSGTTVSGLSASASANNVRFGSGSIYDEFVGTGNIQLSLNARGSSFGSGAGNLLTQFTTQASAVVTVTYDYAAPVPEPASVSLCAAGLCLIGWRARNRMSGGGTRRGSDSFGRRGF